ncbi:hypothetical protein EXU57_09660 [Segetibacter sp. 3557_3]|uniref:DoxX family protein n=1 Tax=Segetibacter sp. 3557_3 TaxID=2547429 RepID=UPI00105899DF|nr:hypothetical protein [Segetibacter sp. 3557_3]TDH27054.1 hypothetical protein EXU57_09660 [Segetibacter sp. 3557_3]
MKPLIVLIIAFVAAIIVDRIATTSIDYGLCGRIAMALMLLFTAIGHFKFTAGMAEMLPVSVPYRKELVYFTGVLEIVAAAGLLFDASAKATGWFLVVFFIVLLPANIYAAMVKVDYESGTNTGPGISYLWFRVPLQLLFISWVYYFAVYLV